MLGDKKEDTVQIPMESSKPVQPPKAHDPRWVQTRLNTLKWTRGTSNDQPVRLRAKRFTFQFIYMYVCLVWVWRCPVQLTCCDLSLSLTSPTTISLICFLFSSSFPSPCSSGVTPLILIYLMKCLKPLCGNPSTPIQRTFVLWLLRRQGCTLFSSPPSLGNTPAAHCGSLVLCSKCRATSLCSVACKFWVCVF